ncbi:hypothetical protein SprV_0802512500 [Sparganum proliferum]
MTKAIPAADRWADYHLDISKMRIRLQLIRRPKGKRPPGKPNIASLSLPAHHLHLSNELAQRLDNLPVAAAAADGNAPWRTDDVNCRIQSSRQPWLSSVAHDANTRTDSIKTGPPSATCSPRRTACTRPTPLARPTTTEQPSTAVATAGNAGCLDDSQGRVDPKLRGSQRMEEFCLHDHGFLLSANRSNCPSSQRQRQYPTHWEDTFFSDGPSISEASSHVPPPSQTPSLPVCFKWKPTPTPTSRPSSTKLSECLFAAARVNFRLIIKTEKTVVMHRPAPQINVTYLCSILSRDKNATMKWHAGFPRPAKPSVVCKTQFGIDTVFTSALSSRCTELSS